MDTSDRDESKASPSMASTTDLAARLRKEQIRASLFSKPPKPITIGSFVLRDYIGAGAMGEVYTAWDENLRREIAIKLVRTGSGLDPHAERRLLREAWTLALLSHPNVVQVYDAGTFEGRVFVAMEYVPGQTLAAWLDVTSTLPGRARQRAILAMFISAGRGIAAAHQKGLTHRDFKPDNVIVGEDGRPRVVDFGLARSMTQPAREPPPDRAADGVSEPERRSILTSELDLTAANARVGTPRYMSPEQLRGEPADSRSDQFSFCVALYEALYEARPFPADGLDELSELVESGAIAPAPRGVEVPPPVRRALLRGLSVDPAERFPDMDALLDELERGPGRRRRRQLSVVIGSAVPLLAVVSYLAWPLERDPCVDAGDAIYDSWNPGRKAALRGAFEETGHPLAADHWEQAEAALDRYAATWQAESVRACQAVRDGTETKERHERRAYCLHRRKNQFTGLLDRFAHADRKVVTLAVAATEEVDATICSKPEYLVYGPEPPPDPKTQTAVDAIRNRLQEADHERLDGRTSLAFEIALDQLKAANEIRDYRLIYAEALYSTARARVHRETEAAYDRAIEELIEALAIAIEYRDLALADKVRSALVLLSYRHPVPLRETGPFWADVMAAEALLFKLHSSQSKPAALADARCQAGLVHYEHGTRRSLKKAVEHQELGLQHAKGIRAEDKGAARVIAACSHGLANTLRALEQNERADGYYTEAERELERYGSDDPGLARVRFDWALALIEWGAFDRAERLLEKVDDTWHLIYESDHKKIAEIKVVFAQLGIDRFKHADDKDRKSQHLEGVREQLEAAYSIYKRRYPGDLLALAGVRERQGIVSFYQDRYDDVISAYGEALEIRLRLEPNKIETAVTSANVAEALVQLHRCEDARKKAALAMDLLHKASATEQEENFIRCVNIQVSKCDKDSPRC